MPVNMTHLFKIKISVPNFFNHHVLYDTCANCNRIIVNSKFAWIPYFLRSVAGMLTQGELQTFTTCTPERPGIMRIDCTQRSSLGDFCNICPGSYRAHSPPQTEAWRHYRVVWVKNSELNTFISTKLNYSVFTLHALSNLCTHETFTL